MSDITATQAVAHFRVDHPAAVGYLIPQVGGPQVRPVLVRLDKDRLVTRIDSEVVTVEGLDESWEVRLFDDSEEMHWMSRQGTGTGRCVVRSDAAAKALHQKPLTEPSRTLLWGQISEVPGDGWVRLSDARIGSFWAPVTAGQAPALGGYVAFLVREYLSHDEYNNYFIADERYYAITALSVAEATWKPAGKGKA